MSRITERKKDRYGNKYISTGGGAYFEEESVYEALEKLAHYEDLEEQGRLIELPCKVGDTVYSVHSAGLIHAVIAETYADAFFLMLSVAEGRFGKTVFLTKEEAEAKLAELKGE